MTGTNAEEEGSAALPSPVQWLSTESECAALGKAVGFYLWLRGCDTEGEKLMWLQEESTNWKL